MVDVEMRFYGVIGFLVRYLFSLVMYNVVFRVFGINVVYLVFEVFLEEFGEVIGGVKVFGIFGLNVIMFYKEVVIYFFDLFFEDLGEIGSVNMVVNRKGRLEGYIIDGLGVRRVFERVIELGGRRIFIIGVGGVGKVIVYEFFRDNEVVVFNRIFEKVKVLECFGIMGDVLNRENFGEYLEWVEVLINVIFVGMNFWEIFVFVELLRRDFVVMDIVYKFLKMCFFIEVELRGCKIVDGFWMFVY